MAVTKEVKETIIAKHAKHDGDRKAGEQAIEGGGGMMQKGDVAQLLAEPCEHRHRRWEQRRRRHAGRSDAVPDRQQQDDGQCADGDLRAAPGHDVPTASVWGLSAQDTSRRRSVSKPASIMKPNADTIRMVA